MLFFNVRRTVLSTGRFLPLTYIGQYLRTSLVGTCWGGSAPGIAWAEARGAAERCRTQDTPSPGRSCAVRPHHVRLFAATRTVAHQAPLSMGFSRQGCSSGLPFPTPGGLPTSLASPALAGVFFTTMPPGKPTPRMTRTTCQCQSRTRIEKLAVEANPALTMGPETGVRVAFVCVCVCVCVCVWHGLM